MLVVVVVVVVLGWRERGDVFPFCKEIFPVLCSVEKGEERRRRRRLEVDVGRRWIGFLGGFYSFIDPCVSLSRYCRIYMYLGI